MSERLTKLFFVFKCFGLITPNYDHLSHKKCDFNLLWLNILLTLFFGGHHIMFNQVFFSLDPIGKFSDVLETFLPLLVHIVLLLEMCYKSNYADKMRSLINEIDFYFVNSNPILYRNTKATFQTLIILKFLVYNLICISTEIFIIFTIAYNITWAASWRTRIFSVVALRFGDLVYIYYVDHLTSYSSMINYELQRLNICTDSILVMIKMKKKLAQLKEIDWKVWKLSSFINKRYRLFLLFNILNQTLYLIINCFWIYSTIYFKSNPAYLR